MTLYKYLKISGLLFCIKRGPKAGFSSVRQGIKRAVYVVFDVEVDLDVRREATFCFFLCGISILFVYLQFVYNTCFMKKIVFTLLAISFLASAMAQGAKCGIDTKALMREEMAAGARSINFLAKMAPGYDRDVLEKAGIAIGAEAGQIVALRVPTESVGVLESDKEVLEYSISHRIAAPDCDRTRHDTRADSVQNGWGMPESMRYTGEGVYIGITDWGFDYTHPNYNGQNHSNWRIARVCLNLDNYQSLYGCFWKMKMAPKYYYEIRLILNLIFC